MIIDDMSAAELSKEVIDTMLGHLGFTSTIEVVEEGAEVRLHISSPQSALIIGKKGSRLDDIQYLVNRIMLKKMPSSPRVKVDCEHYREEQEEKLRETGRQLAQKVLVTGKPQKTKPLNAYHRRVFYSGISEVEGVKAHSSDSKERYKQITVSLKES